MRKFDVAYNPRLPDSGELKKKVDDMTLDELSKEIMKICAKCHGDYTICEECMGCLEGKTIVQKLKEEPYDRYAGIRKMKNMSPANKQIMAKNLYKEALMSGKPVEYLMEKCGIDEIRAKDRLRVYNKKYRYIKDKLNTLKGMAEHMVLEPKKMVELVPKKEDKVEKKEQTVSELIKNLRYERVELLKRLKDIENDLKVMEKYEQVSCKESAV